VSNTKVNTIKYLAINCDSNQAGGWSQEGVVLDKDNSDESKVTCLATHLTSFAVLVSVGDGPEKKVK